MDPDLVDILLKWFYRSTFCLSCLQLSHLMVLLFCNFAFHLLKQQLGKNGFTTPGELSLVGLRPNRHTRMLH
ncbi:Rfx transcription factor [Echinococcus multilocularis]|uniref:Rfx transcription factor n=1 Tax=Echinococcus multilocularis TaxID=6211 RepID=A0A068XZ84_ECHMU|nr:Rfx transcription factor [Echinococcus multilocularis]